MILKALALGLSSGIFCLGYCYPILGPIMFSSEERRGWSRAAQSLGLFLAGRLIAYLIFGLLAGLLGQRVQLRYMPHLRFEYDTSLRDAARMEELLRGIDVGSADEGE